MSKKNEIMRQGGKFLSSIMEVVLSNIAPGITGLELNDIYAQELKKIKATSAFMDYQGFPAHICVNVNDMIVHGVPDNKPLSNGDVVSIDMGLKYQGYFSDMTRATIVGKDIYGHQKFVDAGYQALQYAISKAKVGLHIGDISHEMQTVIEKEYKFKVSRDFVGHGIGKELHENPYIPGYGRSGKGELLYLGQTLAIEIIYIKAKTDKYYTEDDKWTVRSVGGEVAAVVEDTVIVGVDGGEKLT